MSDATITSLTTEATAAVLLVLGYEANQEAPSLAHRIIGKGRPEFTIKDVGPRAGRLDVLVADRGAALAVLASPGALTLTSDVRPVVDMTFLVTGQITQRLDDETRVRWVLSFDFTATT